MKVLLLAGGMGTRLSEETVVKPKPMVEIGGMPILWHIMKLYSHHGFNEFVILLGYKGYMIKEYFANYFLHQSDLTIDLNDNSVKIHKNSSEPWKITLLDTGQDTLTGGRVLRARKIVGDQPFLLTYGDGVGDVDVSAVCNFHRSHGKALTMTSAQPEGRFGALNIEADSRVSEFQEKPKGDGNWINAGFFVCQPQVFEYIREGDKTVFEKAPLQDMARSGELYTYKHRGFWKPMDTVRDRDELVMLWERGAAPWKVWHDKAV